MWRVIRSLLQAEIDRLWRRMLRRPERPGSFSGYRRPDDETAPRTESSPGKDSPLVD